MTSMFGPYYSEWAPYCEHATGVGALEAFNNSIRDLF